MERKIELVFHVGIGTSVTTLSFRNYFHAALSIPPALARSSVAYAGSLVFGYHAKNIATIEKSETNKRIERNRLDDPKRQKDSTQQQ